MLETLLYTCDAQTSSITVLSPNKFYRCHAVLDLVPDLLADGIEEKVKF